MAALTGDRNTRCKWIAFVQAYKVKASAKIFAGSIVSIEAATGFARAGTDAANERVAGIASALADNTSGADAAIKVLVEKGVFKLGTSGGSALVQADVEASAFLLDDQTVVKTGGTANARVAGTVLEIESATEVWVRVGI